MSVILPCLNEALDAMSSAGLSGEVVLVDNGSTDGSAEIARMADARVVVEDRPGYGSALRAGFAAAGGPVAVIADADFTYDLGRVPGWRHLRLILLRAPDLLLIGPGVTLLSLGVLLCLLGFLAPAGVEVGSSRWQPVFFSGIALVLGVQAILAGTVLAHR